MDIYSQHHLRVAATEPEHLLRKAELDQAAGNLALLKTQDKSNLVSAINELASSVPPHRQRGSVGGMISKEPNGRAKVQLFDAMGFPAGRVVRNVMMLPVTPPVEIDTETSGLICRARKDNPLNNVEIV
jgi:hypothetical protein